MRKRVANVEEKAAGGTNARRAYLQRLECFQVLTNVELGCVSESERAGGGVKGRPVGRKSRDCKHTQAKLSRLKVDGANEPNEGSA